MANLIMSIWIVDQSIQIFLTKTLSFKSKSLQIILLGSKVGQKGGVRVRLKASTDHWGELLSVVVLWAAAEIRTVNNRCKPSRR